MRDALVFVVRFPSLLGGQVRSVGTREKFEPRNFVWRGVHHSAWPRPDILIFSNDMLLSFTTSLIPENTGVQAIRPPR